MKLSDPCPKCQGKYCLHRPPDQEWQCSRCYWTETNDLKWVDPADVTVFVGSRSSDGDGITFTLGPKEAGPPPPVISETLKVYTTTI